MKITKVVKAIAKVGGWIVDVYEKVVDFADHIIHKEKYERAKRRKLFWTIFLAVLGGIVVVLMFPYRLIVKRNGDFEIRTLLLRVYRKSPEEAVSEEGSDGFDIEPAVADAE